MFACLSSHFPIYITIWRTETEQQQWQHTIASSNTLSLLQLPLLQLLLLQLLLLIIILIQSFILILILRSPLYYYYHYYCCDAGCWLLLLLLQITFDVRTNYITSVDMLWHLTLMSGIDQLVSIVLTILMHCAELFESKIMFLSFGNMFNGLVRYSAELTTNNMW